MQNERKEHELWSRLLWLLLLLLPLAILFLTPGGAFLGGGIWFLITVLLSFWLIRGILGSPMKCSRVEPQIHTLDTAEEPSAVREVMGIRVRTEEAGIKVFRGKLSVPAAIAYEKLKLAFRGSAIPMVREDDQAGAAILLVPDATGNSSSERPIRAWVHWLLFGLTLMTTTWAGAAHQGVDLLREPGRFVVGLPYALGLMAILGVHELGHYFTARKHGMRVTPPYFIQIGRASCRERV